MRAITPQSRFRLLRVSVAFAATAAVFIALLSPGSSRAATFTVTSEVSGAINLSVSTGVFSDTGVTFNQLEIVDAAPVFGGAPSVPAPGTITSSTGSDLVSVIGQLNVASSTGDGAASATLTLTANYQ